jgi:YwiC-like protein
MLAGMSSAAERATRIGPHLPRQHGAWAMLAIPLAIGVAASHPAAADVILAIAAAASYLLAATAQSAIAARDRRRYAASVLLLGSVAGATSAGLVVLAPALALALVVLLPTATVSVALARLRRQRSLASSLMSAVQAVLLAPAAAFLGGMSDPGELARVALVAAVYLVGSVLVVRSVIRERDNDAFTAGSVAAHLAAVASALALPQVPYGLLFIGLTVRAALVPVVGRARARRGLGIRPAFIGLEEGVAGIAVILVVVMVRP